MIDVVEDLNQYLYNICFHTTGEFKDARYDSNISKIYENSST